MTIQLTTIVDYRATDRLESQCGLAILIEADNVRILFDTGPGDILIHNAKVLNVDLSNLDAVVLSHGHCDHTGGLLDLLECCGPVKVVAHPDIWTHKFSCRIQYHERYIGIPFVQKELENLGAQFVHSTKSVALADNILTSGQVPMDTAFEKINDALFRRADSNSEPDPMHDDLSLAIKTPTGLVIVMGCAHRGPVNTINHFRQITGESRIRAVVGGTHLLEATGRPLAETIKAFTSMNLELVMCSQCLDSENDNGFAIALDGVFTLNEAGKRLKIS